MRLEFTPEVKAILNEERYDHPMPLVQRRMEALWLKSGSSLFQVGNGCWGCLKNGMSLHYERYRTFSNGPWFDPALAGGIL
jgi:hypothetical protein